jgi:transcriptional regulator with XRE-family HTH domain
MTQVRLAKGWSQAELAARAGISRDVVANLETSRRGSIGLSQALAIADALEVSLEALMSDRPLEVHVKTVTIQ